MRIFSFINNSYEVLNENFYPILHLKVCQRCDLFRLELIEIKDVISIFLVATLKCKKKQVKQILIIDFI